MRTSLFLRLPASATENYLWAQATQNGELLATGASEFNQLPTADSVVVFAPTTSLLLTQAHIPTRQWQRLLQAVPYALEDDLAADVDTLHFAVAPSRSGETQVAVAALSCDTLQQWLDSLHPLKITLLLPDVLAVPYVAESWSLMLLPDQLLIRTGYYQGFALELEQLSIALPLALAEQENNPPQSLMLYCNSADSHPELIQQLKMLNIPLTVQVVQPNVTALWAAFPVKMPTFNLLQGNYRQNTSHPLLTWRPWRMTAALMGLMFIAYLGTEWQGYQRQKNYHQQLSQEIETLYKNTFPDAQRIVNPRVQMEQQLQQLQASYGQQQTQTYFLPWLVQLSPFIKSISGFLLTRLEYRNNQLELQLELASFEALEALKQQWQQRNMQVEVASAASNRQQRVEARLILRMQ
jgi:general secretion pathway protein L